MPLNHPDVADSEDDKGVDGPEVLAAIDAAFLRDPCIDEFGMLLVEGRVSLDDARQAAGGGEAADGDDVSVLAGCVLLMQHKLAVAYWALPALLPFVASEMRAVAAEAEWWCAEAAAQRMLSLTRAMLLVVADNATAWNHRKRLILGAGHCRLAELAFVDLVQTKHQKSAETWAHRRWLVAPMLASTSSYAAQLSAARTATDETPSVAAHSPQSIWKTELAATERAAALYRKNYSAWTHRMWVTRQLPASQLPALAQVARRHCRMNVSDHAAHHFRCVVIHLQLQQLLRDVACKANVAEEGLRAARNVVCDEQAATEELIQTFPGHPALWLSLRWLFDASLLISLPTASEGTHEYEGTGGSRGWLGVKAELEAWKIALLAGDTDVNAAWKRGSSGLEDGGDGCESSEWLPRQLSRLLRFSGSRFQDRDCSAFDSERIQALLLVGWLLRGLRRRIPSLEGGVSRGDRDNGESGIFGQVESLIARLLVELSPYQAAAWHACLNGGSAPC